MQKVSVCIKNILILKKILIFWIFLQISIMREKNTIKSNQHLSITRRRRAPLYIPNSTSKTCIITTNLFLSQRAPWKILLPFTFEKDENSTFCCRNFQSTKPWEFLLKRNIYMDLNNFNQQFISHFYGQERNMKTL